MYIWRKLTQDQREEALRERKGRRLPWHSPPHLDFEGPVTFIITAACYEHADIIGKSTERLAEFEEELLSACSNAEACVHAWCILPNHYHLLVRTERIARLREQIGLTHGRTAFRWNREDGERGRKVWFNFFDRDMRSQRHFWASMNYVHNNAVHHGYVERWHDWLFRVHDDFWKRSVRKRRKRFGANIRCSITERAGTYTSSEFKL